MSSSGVGLSEEQRRKIEENRKKALERRALLNSQRQAPSVKGVSKPSGSAVDKQNNHAVISRSFPSSKPINTAQTWSRQAHQTTNSNTSQENATSSVLPSSSRQQLESSSRTANNSASDGVENRQNAFRNKTDCDGGPRDFFAPRKPSQTSSGAISFCGDKKLKGQQKIQGEAFFPVTGKVIKGLCVLISSTRFTVKIGFHAQLIALFKTLPSRAYDKATTTWSFSLEDYETLMSASRDLVGVSLEGLPKTVLSLFTKSSPGTLKSLSTEDINLNCVDTKLVSSLMPFQREGVAFCICQDGRAIIADDMGLGKTVQAICVASYYRKEWPLLVVAPSSMRLTWKQAFIKWLPSLDPQSINVVLTGKDNVTAGLINIISYDLLTKFVGKLQEKRFRVIIADESHFIKNNKAARTKTFLPILKAATRVILLSGTPALSRPEELYTQICAVNPRMFPSFHEFGKRYCAGVENRWGWDYSGASNMEELQLVLEQSIMIRRLKKDVLHQLPSKRRQMVLLDPSLIKVKPLMKAAKEVETAKKKEQHGALLNYFCETSASKIAAVRNYVLDLLEGGHKFLVFGHHQDMLDAISDCLMHKKYSYIRIDGKTPSSKRQMLCDQFQKDKNTVVAVLSITAANTGLTLTEGTAVVFAELFWNPGALVQAEDRVYRIGQKNSVNIHYLVAKGTADDYLWPLIQHKLDVLSKAGLTKDDFSEADTTLFQDPKQKTLFSCFESLIEECDDDDLIASESDFVTLETSADVKATAKSAMVLSSTNTESRSEEPSQLDQAAQFDWFDDMTGLLSDEETDFVKIESSENKGTRVNAGERIRKAEDMDIITAKEPSAKRYKR